MVRFKSNVRLTNRTVWRTPVSNLSPALRQLATQLASGPSFLLLGNQGLDLLGVAARHYHWNGIYTTATSPMVAEAFVSESRVCTSLGAMERTPSRSQSDLEVRYLFGGTHLPESSQPPTSEVAEAAARQRSNQELTQLVTETITPRGSVIIEGWNGEGRLTSDSLSPILGLLGAGQAHLFSAGDMASDPFVSSITETGQLVLHSESLEVALSAIVDAGAATATSADTRSQHIIPLSDGFVEIDIHTWNQIRRSARPVDLELLTPPILNSRASRYQEFRRFLGATDGVPRWKGIAAQMNLRRDFEDELMVRVLSELKDRDLPSPIVLSGQTATGKSVALAAMAMDLARTGQVAVLHQSHQTVRPAAEDIDMYAAWADEHGAEATVLVWDGMLDLAEYEGLSRQLHARGRKVLVVGSTYKTPTDSSSFVQAPIELSTGETARLVTLLAGFGIEVHQQALESNFLAFLYRLLPETERQLRSGLSKELRAAERSMAKFARERDTAADAEQTLSAMQMALQEAGLVLQDLLPADSAGESLNERRFAERAPIQRVTTLVLAAGQHGILVPIDLALRILGREGYQGIREALASSDIIREIDDDNGEFFLGARSQLEAQLLARHEIPLVVEVEVLIEAIRNARVTDAYTRASDEVEFLVRLLERVGPSSDNDQKYRQYFAHIADALGDRRDELGRAHPRLVLQESNFSRAFVYWQQKEHQGMAADRVAALEYNRDLLDEVLADPGTRGLIRLSLSVELASTLGAIIHEYTDINQGGEVPGIRARLDDVLAAVRDARAVDPGNVYPVDVLAWATRDAVNSGALTPAERIDSLANAVATLESLDRESLEPRQLAKLDKRGAELSELLKNDDAVWDYLKRLELNKSPAATYFLAQIDAKDGPDGEAKALARLRQVPAQTKADWRCAQLLIDLTWKEITGSRLLLGERVPLHLSSGALLKIAELASALEYADMPDGYRFLFIRAIAEFASGNYSEAQRLFREVGDLTRQLSKRIYTAYLLADKSGKPKTYTGRVQMSDTRSGQVWVNELGTRVKFEPRLFSVNGVFSRNQQLQPFHIGFKLSRGPIAEPRSIYRKYSGLS